MNFRTDILRRICAPLLAAVALTVSQGAMAATVAGGALTLNIDSQVLATFNGGLDIDGARYLYVEDYLGQSFNNQSVSGTSPDPVPGTGPLPSTSGLAFVVNPYSALSSPPGRALQASSLNFGAVPEAGTGQVGLSGMLRLRSDFFAGYLTPGDFTLAYDGANWVLVSHDPNPIFGAKSFLNLVTTAESFAAGAWSLSGNLTMGADWGNFLGVAPGSPLGTFTFQTSAVPVPGALWMLGSGLLAVGSLRRRQQR